MRDLSSSKIKRKPLRKLLVKANSKGLSSVEHCDQEQKKTIKTSNSSSLERNLKAKQKHTQENTSSLPVISKSNDIDDLFVSLKEFKKKKKEEAITKQNEQIVSLKLSRKKLAEPKAKTFVVSPEAPIERIDRETGYPVYKAHLLKVGGGGGTPLCPFDCDCCF